MAREVDQDLEVQMKWGVRIPLRDGVHLNATLYLPKDADEPRPTVFSFTPYSSQAYHIEGRSYAAHGFPYLAVDARGRGNSEGEFKPFFTEAADGYDIVEWIARQSYCNGKVAGSGHSYVGFNQWAMVRDPPPHLVTMVPSAPCFVGLDFPIRHNIFFSFLANWLLLTWGNALQDQVSHDDQFWANEYLRFLKSGFAYKDLDKFFGFDSKIFKEWVKHPRQDTYWDQANPTPGDLAGFTLPILSITGVYDGDQAGTLEFYRQHLLYASDKANHYLVIGPWDHEGVRTPQSTVFGIQCGPESIIDMKKLHREWYEWTMLTGPRPEFLKARVAYYVMDADKWRYADDLEQVTARTELLYLCSESNPSDVFHSGSLAPGAAGRADPDHYTYDPLDLSGPTLETSLVDADLTDQRLLLSTAGAKLVYHSAPFESDTEISGFFKLTAWLAIDQPDTDFLATIFDVSDDGTSVYLTSQFLRARYRESLRVETLIDTGEPLRYDFERFSFVSRRLRKGHRLRLVVGPNDSIHWQRNYNSGRPNAEETAHDARTVTVRLFHDAAYPSVLGVPMGRPEA